MRPAIAIFCVMVAGVVLAAMVSLRTPRPDPLPAEIEAAKNAEKNKPQAETKPAEAGGDPQAQFDKVKEGAMRASLEIVGKGTIEFELYPKAAPKTVAHFTELAAKNFWDGIKVHREEKAVIQMGDPLSKDVQPEDFEIKGIGSHGSNTTTVPLEVEAKLPNVQYTLGLARTSAPDSGDSQFYINLINNPGFDYDYCVFGRVTKGTDIVSTIKKGDVIKHIQVYEARPTP
jgi:cyclophilin family peptidyl-prolyl cis-trans isomerase